MFASTLPRTQPNSPPERKRLLRRVLRSDPGQEYLVYVPRSADKRAPLFVCIHGVSRNADQQAQLLCAYADIYGTVLVAPIFSREQYPDFQRLGRIGRSKRADLLLNQVVADAAAMTGASGERIHLFGFSGGAQFAHRYFMAHPHRVAAAVIAAAGWYTFPNPIRRFPYGTRMNNLLPDVRFDAEEFLNVPVTVMVDADDVGQSGLRRKERLDREQGVTRVERARRWAAAMQDAAAMHHLESRVTYQEIADCGHSFSRAIMRGGLGDKVFRALFGAPPVRATGG